MNLRTNCIAKTTIRRTLIATLFISSAIWATEIHPTCREFLLARNNVYVHVDDADLLVFLQSNLGYEGVHDVRSPVFAARIDRFAQALAASGASPTHVENFNILLQAVRSDALDNPVLHQLSETLTDPQLKNLIMASHTSGDRQTFLEMDQNLYRTSPRNDEFFPTYQDRIIHYLREALTPGDSTTPREAAPAELLSLLKNPHATINIDGKPDSNEHADDPMQAHIIFPGSAELHELVHWNDALFEKKWLAANMRLMRLGLEPDLVFQNFVTLQDGKPLISDAFSSLFTEMRAYDVSAYLGANVAPRTLNLAQARELTYSVFLMDQFKRGHLDLLRKLGIIPNDLQFDMSGMLWLIPQNGSTKFSDRILPLVEGPGSIYNVMNQSILLTSGFPF